jgi:hypothetical protein
MRRHRLAALEHLQHAAHQAARLNVAAPALGECIVGDELYLLTTAIQNEVRAASGKPAAFEYAYKLEEIDDASDQAA